MRVFRLTNPKTNGSKISSIKSIAAIGTWKVVGGCASKNNCAAQVLSPPLIIDVERDGVQLSEVLWSGLDFIISKRIAAALTNIGSHWDFTQIKCVARADDCAAIQDYQWPIPNKLVSIDPQANSLTRELICKRCGASRWSYKDSDIIFPASLIDTVDCFRIDSGIAYPGPVYVTEQYAMELKAHRIPNVVIREVGVTDTSERSSLR